MKRYLVIAITSAVFLSACGSKPVVVYRMSLRAPDAAKAMYLIEATERVMLRRLAAAEVQGAQVSTLPVNSDSATLTMKLPNSAAAGTAERILGETFTFDIRLEKPGANPDQLDTSEWQPTALTGASLQWIQVIASSSTGEVGVELEFTPAGRGILESIFKGNKGKHVGIFVRDLLVSKLKIDSETVSDHIIISGIPSDRVAEIFADDVNVGLRVNFSPTH